MMCDGADWYFRGVFLGPAAPCVPPQSASHIVCASPQYVDQQWDVNPRPSARELLDKDVKNQDSQNSKLANLNVTNSEEKNLVDNNQFLFHIPK